MSPRLKEPGDKINALFATKQDITGEPAKVVPLQLRQEVLVEGLQLQQQLQLQQLLKMQSPHPLSNLEEGVGQEDQLQLRQPLLQEGEEEDHHFQHPLLHLLHPQRCNLQHREREVLTRKVHNQREKNFKEEKQLGPLAT